MLAFRHYIEYRDLHVIFARKLPRELTDIIITMSGANPRDCQKLNTILAPWIAQRYADQLPAAPIAAAEPIVVAKKGRGKAAPKKVAAPKRAKLPRGQTPRATVIARVASGALCALLDIILQQGTRAILFQNNSRNTIQLYEMPQVLDLIFDCPYFNDFVTRKAHDIERAEREYENAVQTRDAMRRHEAKMTPYTAAYATGAKTTLGEPLLIKSKIGAAYAHVSPSGIPIDLMRKTMISVINRSDKVFGKFTSRDWAYHNPSHKMAKVSAQSNVLLISVLEYFMNRIFGAPGALQSVDKLITTFQLEFRRMCKFRI